MISSRLALILAAMAMPSAIPRAWAQPQQLKGAEFVTVMKGNTLEATSKAGVKFKAYFLEGGIATYKDEKGVEDHGRWRIKGEDQVCVTWSKIDAGQERCARVFVDGREVIWKGDNVSGEGKLLGIVR